MSGPLPAGTLAGLVALALLLGTARPAYAAEPGWRYLFDGNSMAGWRQSGPGRFVLEDGTLRSEGGMGLLWYTKEKFADVELQVSFKTATAEANSGVFVRIPEPPQTPWDAVHGGYEVQIDASGDDYHRTGVLYSLTEALAEPPLKDWNHLQIVLDGPHTQVAVNGVVVTRFSEGDPVPARRHDWEPERGPRPLAGYIGLQNHGTGDVVYFRDIRVRSLAVSPPT